MLSRIVRHVKRRLEEGGDRVRLDTPVNSSTVDINTASIDSRKHADTVLSLEAVHDAVSRRE